jgi:hypothetical protein
MSIAIDHKSWKKDHHRWQATTKKWQSDQKKVCRAVEQLEKYLKQHNQELKTFLKKAKTQKSLMLGKNHSSSLHKNIKKTHLKQNRYYACQAKSHKNLLKLSKTIENTIKNLH